jgi:hypothetical protein
MGLVMASKRHVLALQKAIGGRTGGTDLFFPFQGIHKDLLFPEYENTGQPAIP